MAPLTYTHVDAFTSTAFTGNPAAVFVLPESAESAALFDNTCQLQTVAKELNLPAHAFVLSLPDSTVENPHYRIRYFSTFREIPLCGHATMATSHVLFSAAHHPDASSLTFETNLGFGQLVARRSPDHRISLGFPSDEGILLKVHPTEERYQAAVNAVSEATGLAAEAVVDVAFSSRVCLVEIGREVDLRQLQVAAKLMAHVANFVVLSQPSPLGSPYDIYSRVFTAAVGADEDPVCGSAHCFIGPRWLGTPARERLEKTSFRDPGFLEIKAKQVSERGGEIDVRWDPVAERITLTGEAVSILTGQFLLQKGK